MGLWNGLKKVSYSVARMKNSVWDREPTPTEKQVELLKKLKHQGPIPVTRKGANSLLDKLMKKDQEKRTEQKYNSMSNDLDSATPAQLNVLKMYGIMADQLDKRSCSKLISIINAGEAAKRDVKRLEQLIGKSMAQRQTGTIKTESEQTMDLER
ncbi:MAG: hypothetical protein HQL69_02545 [Magnetococcales bacterium]|nr:hypothetical protein [Magnetococcales bacterium]